MKSFLSIVLLVLTLATCAQAETFKVKIADALNLHEVYRSLDGIQKDVLIDGKTVLIIESYEFSGSARMIISRNFAALDAVWRAFEATRMAVLKEVSGGKDRIEKEDTVRMALFLKKLTEASDMIIDVDLTRLTEANLNLDVNKKMPGTLVSALLPYLTKK